MCHGANQAFVELSHFGTITSGSIMVPCPWFSEIAEIAAGDDSPDCGIHLTLNAEKKHYRWGPVSSVGPSSGLVDEHGYLRRTVAEVRRNAHPNAVGGTEIEVIEPDTFHVRTGEYELFGADSWKGWLTGQLCEPASMGDLA